MVANLQDMLTEYIAAAMKRARYEILPEDHSYYGEIPGFEGAYANQTTLEACRNELQEVLEEWILVSVSRSLPLPVVDGIEISVHPVPDASLRTHQPGRLDSFPKKIGI